jgi:hypothetical protein
MCRNGMYVKIIKFHSLISFSIKMHAAKHDNKHCSEILQETLLNSVSNDLLPFMVGQSHYTCTLLNTKNVMLFSIVNRPFKCCAQSTDRGLSEANLSVT